MTDFEPSVTAARAKEKRNRHPKKDTHMSSSPDIVELLLNESYKGQEGLRFAAADEIKRLRASQPSTPTAGGGTIITSAISENAVKLCERLVSLADTEEMAASELEAPDTDEGNEEAMGLRHRANLYLEAEACITILLDAATATSATASDAVAGEAKAAGCICQDQHRLGYCTEPGCSLAQAARAPAPAPAVSEDIYAEALRLIRKHMQSGDTVGKMFMRVAKELDQRPPRELVDREPDHGQYAEQPPGDAK